MAKTNLKHYVQFLYPGTLFLGTLAKEVSSRDLEVEAPKECFGYRFFDRQESVAKDGEVLIGGAKNYSGTHYFGKLMTLGDVKREVPNSNILVSNMEVNGYDRVVRTRKGNFQTFTDEDTLIAEE